MSTKLTDSQRALLLGASRREDRFLVLPPNLKGGVAQKVGAKLIGEGLAKQVKAKTGAPIWRRDVKNDQAYSLRLSAAGAKAIATSEEPSVNAASESLAQVSHRDSVAAPEIAHRGAQAEMPAPRQGSKLASVMVLLRRPEGATIGALTKATGWLPHTMRTAITGVRKRGYSVILDRSLEGASVNRLSHRQESEATTFAPQTKEENKAVGHQRNTKAKAVA
jgi:hypothetical protein